MKKLILMLCGMTMLLMVIGCSEERTKLTEFATSPESDFVEFEEGVFNDSPLGKHAAGCVTLEFNASGFPLSYTESGITVTSLNQIFPHLHLEGTLLMNHDFTSTPYEFRHEGGESFAVVSVDVIRMNGVGDFVSSDGAVVPIQTIGTITFPAGGWSNITSFRWNMISGSSWIDNLVICQAASSNEPPTLDLFIDVENVWPPNHKMVLVAHGSAGDLEDSPGDLDLDVTVTSSEDTNGKGDGNTSPDWSVVDNGDGTFDVWVRAERSGKGDGRTYTISAMATDSGGLSSPVATGTVDVAHNKK